MLTLLTVTAGTETQTFRFFGIEGNRQAKELGSQFLAKGFTVVLTERAL